MDLITIGRIVKPHSIDGTLEVYPLTDFPQHFKTLKVLYLVKDGTIKRTSLEHVRFHKGHILLKLEKCPDRAMAERWIGAKVTIDSKDLWPLKRGQYYHFQIIGLKVMTEEGECLGEVKEIISTGCNDVFVVRDENKEFLLPAIKDVIKNVDKERRLITVHLLDGLID